MKRVNSSFIIYCLLMVLCMIYCQASFKEIGNTLIQSLLISGVVTCVVVSVLLFVKSEYGNMLGIIPKKYYLTIISCGLVFAAFSALVTILKTQTFHNAAWFLPVFVCFYAGDYLKKKFHID